MQKNRRKKAHAYFGLYFMLMCQCWVDITFFLNALARINILENNTIFFASSISPISEIKNKNENEVILEGFNHQE
jgi:hypothetical protein